MSDDHKHEDHNPTVSVFFRAVFSIAILLAAGGLAFYFIQNPPEAEKKPHIPKPAPFVNTQEIQHRAYPVQIEVMGQVIPAREITLKTQVGGKVTEVSPHFVPGGFFDAGADILKIDDADYALAVKTQTAVLNQARASLELEKGQQSIARDELKILEQSTGRKLENSALALREPQLQKARADMESAKASLEQAELNLSRTRIQAPFDALLTARNTDLGNVVSPQDSLATLVSTDTYWVDIEIPVHDLHWLDFPASAEEKGSKAIIHTGAKGDVREGDVFKKTGTIDTQSRLAKLIIRVQDPLLLEKESAQGATLVLGDYVKTTLIGKELKNTVRIPLRYIRDNRSIWIYEDGRLKITPVTIAHEDRNNAYVTHGIPRGALIITSDIITPIDGMALQITEPARPQVQE